MWKHKNTLSLCLLAVVAVGVKARAMDEELRVKRGSEDFSCPIMWDKDIKYTIGSFDADSKSLIEKAMEGIMENSCLSLELVSDAPDGPYMHFEKIASGHCSSTIGQSKAGGKQTISLLMEGSGGCQTVGGIQHEVLHALGRHCSSTIGQSKAGGKQTISLLMEGSGGCQTVGGIQHEVLHALGFSHEMQRPDRDDYIEIHKENINNMGMFKKFSADDLKGCDSFWGKDWQAMMGPFDVASVMMYNQKFNQKAGATGDTYSVRDMSSDGGSRNYLVDAGHKTYATLSFGDARRLNSVYKCTDGCDKHKCHQQGFAAKDKDGNCRCICPLIELDPDTGCKEIKARKKREVKVVKRNAERPTCDTTAVFDSKTKTDTIVSEPYASDPSDAKEIRNVQCFNIQESEGDILHISFMNGAYVDSGAGDNYLLVTDNSLADTSVRYGNGSVDTSKMAFAMEGSAWIELSIERTNGYGVGFTAVFSRTSLKNYMKNCVKEEGGKIVSHRVCHNGGVLEASGSSCDCTCAAGYKGETCEKFSDSKCAKIFPCQNGGAFDVSSCSCKCPEMKPNHGAFMGDSCEYFEFCHNLMAEDDPNVAMAQGMGLSPVVEHANECIAGCPFKNIRTLTNCPLSCGANCKTHDMADDMAPGTCASGAMGECGGAMAGMLCFMCRDMCSATC